MFLDFFSLEKTFYVVCQFRNIFWQKVALIFFLLWDFNLSSKQGSRNGMIQKPPPMLHRISQKPPPRKNSKFYQYNSNSRNNPNFNNVKNLNTPKRNFNSNSFHNVNTSNPPRNFSNSNSNFQKSNLYT